MKPYQIADKVYSVGVIDWNIRDFHGYTVPDGTSYNAFLILDEKTVLIDTVKKEFTSKFIDNISEIIDPKKIDIVVSNHTEMDHSGALPHIMIKIGNDKPLYCSKMGKKNLYLHFKQNWNFKEVENYGELNIGKKNLIFLETRMIHWPDSMFTYIKEDGILFSSDGFGQHYAGFEKYADKSEEDIFEHAKKYFANILLLYSPKIKKLISDIIGLNLNIKTICPDHGLLWRKNPEKIIEAYIKWCDQIPEKKAVIIYDTMWKSTKIIAEKIAEGIAESGVAVKPLKLRDTHRSDIIAELFDAKAVVVGSPTMNNNMFPTVADILTYIKGLKPQNKIGAAFGSYGWSGEAVKQINQQLETIGIKPIDEGLRLLYIPDEEGQNKAFEYGKKIGEAVKAA
ncbi:MAG: flavodoxin domain-containing protein [Deltaproteobacteria bacterium]|nr:flavodoxin domain-containing protein [Deltaproteobacteria bacterium]